MSRLFHVSDLHFGREDKAAIRWFEETVHAEKPDALLVTGDLTMQARSREYRMAQEWLLSLDTPITVEPGNHDLPYFNPVARFFHPYARYRAVEKAVERPLGLAGVALVPLRTTTRAQWRTNWSFGVVHRADLDTALAALRAAPEDAIRIVACHHPLVDAAALTSQGRTRGGLDALGALADAGADLVLSGHVHDPFDILWQGAGRTVRLVGAGTLSERIRTSRPSFNLIETYGRTAEVTPRVMGAAVTA